jgi:8-oxo-dGTP pyrophosphatase MutT (NUDIX family)
MPGRPRLGAVLALLFCRRHELHVLLTKRHDDLPSHPGQISFPGGRNEAPESLLATALRETEEEVGIAAPDVEILGALAPIYVPPSDYEVHPFVAWFSSGESPIFRAAPQEVDRILEAPLATFLDSASRVEEPWDIRGQQVLVPYFVVGEYKVWGATAVMLSELVERLRVVLQ